MCDVSVSERIKNALATSTTSTIVVSRQMLLDALDVIESVNRVACENTRLSIEPRRYYVSNDDVEI